MIEKKQNGMEQFEGFEKLKKIKNRNGMGLGKWIIQIYDKRLP